MFIFGPDAALGLLSRECRMEFTAGSGSRSRSRSRSRSLVERSTLRTEPGRELEEWELPEPELVVLRGEVGERFGWSWVFEGEVGDAARAFNALTRRWGLTLPVPVKGFERWSLSLD